MRLIDADALWYDMETADWYNNADRDEIAELLVLRAPTIGGWISVNDRLPEQVGCRCLVSAEYADGKRTVFTAFTGYGEPRWWTYDITHMGNPMYADNHVHHNYHITHWMPLPEPPEENKDD